MSNIYRQAVMSRGQRRQTPQSREGLIRNMNKDVKIGNLNDINNIEEL